MVVATNTTGKIFNRNIILTGGAHLYGDTTTGLVDVIDGDGYIVGPINSTGNAVITGNLTFSGIMRMSGTPQTLTGAGAVNLTTAITWIVTTGANALTLAAGSEGQRKTIIMKTDGGDGTLTVTNFAQGTTITFNDAGDAVDMVYTNAKWYCVGNVGCTIA